MPGDLPEVLWEEKGKERSQASLGHGSRARRVCWPNLQPAPAPSPNFLAGKVSLPHFRLQSEMEPKALGILGRGGGDLSQPYSELETEILTVTRRRARQAAPQDSGSERESLDLFSHLHVGDQAVG